MQKPISPRVHGILDYATALTTAAAPRALGFPERAEQLCYTLAGGYSALSMLTDYPLSARRMVPFKAHGAAEVALGVALPALPWLMGFAGHRGARNFFLGLTALTAVVAALTDWEGEEADLRHSRRRSRRRSRAPRLKARAA
jgi:hypothetical protein